MQTEKQKMLAGELYNAADAQLQADQAAAAEWMVRYNATGAQASAAGRTRWFRARRVSPPDLLSRCFQPLKALQSARRTIDLHQCLHRCTLSG